MRNVLESRGLRHQLPLGVIRLAAVTQKHHANVPPRQHLQTIANAIGTGYNPNHELTRPMGVGRANGKRGSVMALQRLAQVLAANQRQPGPFHLGGEPTADVDVAAVAVLAKLVGGAHSCARLSFI